MAYETKKITALIDDLELCHHKAARHVDLIVEAIGKGATTKGMGTRPAGRKSQAEHMWQNAVDILGAWLSDKTEAVTDLDVGGHSGRDLLGHLGQRSALKEWQVQRVVAKIRQYLDPNAEYHEMVEHPERYEDHRDFRDVTVEMKIRDTKDGAEAQISLAAAIDHLQPCNWNFPENLVIVLRAINGDLEPSKPFAAHARNIRLNPIAGRMRIVAETLGAFCGRPAAGRIDQHLLDVLGAKSPDKETLATMLQEKITGAFGP